jgi:hypothetical protein
MMPGKEELQATVTGKKAMKQCGRAAQATGAGIGAVVSLKVDYRTHSHAQGLFAIVSDNRKDLKCVVCRLSSVVCVN